ncbi:DEAD/DEAH box helicase [Solobacterium sp.]|uniref:DEAD/DEAH box helicase n=1 Tax=unclassified Bulleidia TaxID=2704656 RepID=UPI0029FED59B|nr:DEAD/DEAH box helicase [Solobacterium sp.]
MFDVNKWNKLFENYINYHQPFDLDYVPDQNALDHHRFFTFKRMFIAADQYLKRECGTSDYLIAIRDYLITCKTKLHLEIYPDDNLQDFGLYVSDGELCVSYQLPNYVDSTFVKSAFLADYSERTQKKSYENLCTDPYIQWLTSYVSYRSMSQKLAVTGALNTPAGYTTLISIPTGGGKSLVTQAVAYQNIGFSDSLTIVVVPTVSLALDQERVAKNTLRIAKDNEIFSYSSGVDSAPIIKAIEDKKARLLFISPEALILNSRFGDAIKQANQTRYLANIIIDEAHIVSDWGSLFRVDYQCLESWRNDLILTNDQLRTFLLSATFDERCRDQLKSFFSKDEKWIEIRCDSLRKEPRYCLTQCNSLFEQKKRILELVRKLPHPMIVYVAKPDEAEELRRYLGKYEFKNIRTFTGKTNALKRKKLINEWVSDRFQIMIATSAFGMGVDKNDVRTVIHAYVPQNPNAYYQELGRGGRDRLPCLSVMCIKANDIDAAFQRINKQVMTTEKICKRWYAMYNNPKSKRRNRSVVIDTSIKPHYIIDNEDEDVLESSFVYGNTDMNWNVYVLLFLRRSNLLKIESVVSDSGIYKIQVTDLNEVLLADHPDEPRLLECVEEHRSKEYSYNIDGLNMLKSSIKRAGKECWSEMFMNTYGYADIYCGGCPNHQETIKENIPPFQLKKSISKPEHMISETTDVFFRNNSNSVCYYRTDESKKAVLKQLFEKEVNVIISEESIFSLQTDLLVNRNSMFVIDRNTFEKLAEKKCKFYISGVIVFIYPESIDGITKYVKSFISNRNILDSCRCIHLIRENVELPRYSRTTSDLIDGYIM